jgi:hypothetical protein
LLYHAFCAKLNEEIKMAGKTISITIPEQLEETLRKESEKVGISRSRFIGNLLLEWQKTIEGKKGTKFNDCGYNENGYCSYNCTGCIAPQSEAISCADYK